MAKASMIIGTVAGIYMLFALLAALPIALTSLYPAGITCLVVAGLSLGIIAITRGLKEGRTTTPCVIQGSLGILFSFIVMLIIGITAG
jgi:hypothetical protein